MSQLSSARPRPQGSPAAAVALDFGLRIRLELQPEQRSIFHSAERLPVHALSSELSLLVSQLRVHSFALRYELEQLTMALMRNVDCGFWPLARRAVLDRYYVLALARKRRLDAELCHRGANGALRIAELCAQEARR